MADVTSKCFIKGKNQYLGRPIDWHVWEVYIPTGTLTQAQADTVVIPDTFYPGTAIFDSRMMLAAATASSSGNFTVVLASNEITASNGALANAATLLSVTDLDTVGLMNGAAVTGLSTYADMFVNSSATYVNFKLSLTITPASTFTDGTYRLYVATLMGRIDY